MRVGFDMLYAQGPSATVGIGNYSSNYLGHLTVHPEVEPFLFYDNAPRTGEQYARELSEFIIANDLDIFHLTSPIELSYPEIFADGLLSSVRLVATVYDVIPMIFPEVYLADPRAKALYARQLEMLRRAQRLFAISESTRQDFLRLGFDPHRVIAIGTGTDPSFYCLDPASLDARALGLPTDQPLCLAFNPGDFRKNAHRLVQAFARATSSWVDAPQLVFVSSVSEPLQHQLHQIAEQDGRPTGIHFAGHVSKARLLALFNRAQALLFPSLYEGLGLPVVEAMQCGCPVMTSNVSSLPEIAGDAAIYVNPADVDSIAAGIQRILSDPDLRALLRQRGFAQVERTPWPGVVETTVAEYRRLMDEVPIDRSTRQPPVPKPSNKLSRWNTRYVPFQWL